LTVTIETEIDHREEIFWKQIFRKKYINGKPFSLKENKLDLTKLAKQV